MRAGGTFRAMTAPHDAPQTWYEEELARRATPPSWLARHGQQAAVAVVVVLVLAFAGALAWIVTRPGPTPAGTASTAVPAPVVAVAGTVVLQQGQFVWSRSTNACQGQRGFADVAEGAQVVVTDAGGKVVGVGSLGPGVGQGGSTLGTSGGAVVAAVCELRFTAAVPGGVGPYGVEVGKRGVLRYTEDEIRAVRVGF